MIGESFVPRIFAYCSNFSTPSCPESGNIQKDFCSKIELFEIKEGEEYPEAVDIGSAMTEISKEYCQSCSNFLVKKGLNG
ncbi:MAG: hypothetical protein JRJ66_13680 [Deltaproteobacteria bacterium]|nr:hypothetical protein [Deltaproteobacteria bacterium]MBW2046166.1 hypothetical protein [Deltaproteobacteria bacterium]